MGKYALITGGTKGIGKAVASNLCKEGYNMILTYASDSENADKVRQELISKFSVSVELMQVDISEKESVNLLSDYLIEKDIILDTLVFNAGMTYRNSFEELDWQEWQNVFYANIHFPVFLLQSLINNKRLDNSVIFTGSAMGVYPHSISLAYGVTKSAVHSLVKNLVKFLSPYGIRVNAVAPGFVDTEWQKTKPQEIRQNIEEKIALKRFCEPEELAEVYSLLVKNSYLNGEVIVVDGGYSYR